MSNAASANDAGAVTVEFALVFLLMLATTLGAFDAGAMLLQWLSAETATQMASRQAAIGALVAPGLSAISQNPKTSAFGDSCAGNADCQFATVTCTSAGCSAYGYSAPAFAQIVAAAQVILPAATAANLQVTYSASGLGIVGQPGGPPPLITVSLRNLTYTSLVLNALGFGAANLAMPPFATTAIGEHQ